MGNLAAIVLATPLFGLSLAPPSAPAPLVVAQAAGLPAPALVALAPAPSGRGAEETDEEGAAATSPEAGAADEPDYGTLLAQRAKIASIHKPLGIATWASMTVTLVLGAIQYHNLYGFGDGLGNNPCVTGDAIFGQKQCRGTPWPHLTSALITSSLYGATLALSIVMPDPGGLSDGDSKYAKNLRLHKALRWVHLGGMILQTVFGVVIANGDRFGLDRANDYKALRGLATFHLATGIVTYGALSWAAAMMVF